MYVWWSAGLEWLDVCNFLWNATKYVVYHTIPLLGIYLKQRKAGTSTDIFPPMFISALFIIVRRWKKPKWSLAEEWITKCGIYLQWNIQFNSVAQSCPTVCDPMNCSTPGLPIHHQLPESTQTHVHWVSDAIQPSHPLLSHSPPAFNLSQHQGLFKPVSSSYQVAKVLEFQLQHQSFQRMFRTDLL